MHIIQNNDVKIAFDNQTGTFKPGDIINGNVEFRFIFPKYVRRIYLDFLGEATTSYTKTGLMVKKNQNGNGKLNMTGRDVILQTRIYYVGSQHSSGIDSIPAGTYPYTFEFRLPQNIPPSYQEKNNRGSITYSIKMVIEKADSSKEETIQPIVVETPLIDLRSLHEYFEPTSFSVSKTFGAYCCTVGPMEITCVIQRQAFKPSDTINVKLACDNNSYVKIEAIQVTLFKVMKYNFHSPYLDKIEKKEPIVARQTTAVGKYSSQEFTLDLVIPSSFKPYDLTYCKIIDMGYALNVKAVLVGGYFCPQGDIPIMIGDIVSNEDIPQTIEFGANPPTYNFAMNYEPSAPILKF